MRTISGEAPSTHRALDRLDEIIVRFGTATALVFLVLLVSLWMVTGDTMFLWRAASPGIVALIGVPMLIRRRPRALLQLAVGGVLFVGYTGFIDTGSRDGALLGAVSVAIVGVLLAHPRGRTAILILALWLLGLGVWWSGAANWSERVSDASVPVLLFIFTASLVLWLERNLQRESDAHQAVAEALSISEERFRRAFESAAAGVALVSVEKPRFLQINQAGCAMLGYTEGELIGTAIRDVIHPDDLQPTAVRFEGVGAGEVSHAQGRVRYVRKDGTIAHGLVSAGLVKSSTGEPVHVVVHAVDMSDLIAAEQQLIDLLASKDQLIASVSHELRTPLTAVLGYAEVLKEGIDSLPRAERDDMLRSIADQGADLANIVEDLLVAARADINTLNVSLAPVEIGDEVNQVIAAVGRHADVSNVAVTGGGATAVCDAARVRQIIRNLVTNALRYGGDDVEVRLGGEDGIISLVVADNGAGVPEDERGQIFEAYHRSHDQKGLTASVGLGLTVARTLSRLMGGDLTYRYDGGWSEFRLTLPAAETRPGLEEASPLLSAPDAAARRR